jgi:hypothetical protein
LWSILKVKVEKEINKLVMKKKRCLCRCISWDNSKGMEGNRK